VAPVAVLISLACSCGGISDRPEGGGEADAAPDVPDDPDAAGTDGPVAPEPGAFAWQQHFFTSFPQVEVDGDGGAVVAASFTGSLDLGGEVIEAGALSNLLVARFDPGGSHRASVGYGADGEEFLIEGAVDLEDNATIAGLFRGAADVGGGPIGPAVNFNSYVARYSPAGDHVWSVPIVSPDVAFVRNSSINGSGQAATAGNFTPSVDVLGQKLESLGAADVFYLRLNQAGGLATLARFGGAGNDLGMAALFDGLGRVYLVGVTDGTIEFGAAGTATSQGGRDLFIAQLTEQGDPMWVLTAGGPDDMAELVYAAVAPDGDLLVSGSFLGEMTFPGEDALESEGNSDIFLARVSPTGETRWARRFGGDGNDSTRSIAVGAGGELAITGEFAGTASFGGDDHDSRGFLDFFVARYDGEGELVWSRAAGSEGDDRGLGVAVDGTGAVLVSLAFHDRIELGGEPLEVIGEDFNGALVKYGP
jgi:hypothetical protein